MGQTVTIKQNKYGIIVILDEDKSYNELKEAVAEKFRANNKFFAHAQKAVSFQGKKLDTLQEVELAQIISDNSDLEIACILDEDIDTTDKFKRALEKQDTVETVKGGQFYRGTLRSGQLLESETSIVILGDVNPGAKVVSAGNIVVIGKLNGTVYAGANGNKKAFIVALEMNPQQIRIEEIIAHSQDEMNHTGIKKIWGRKKNTLLNPKMAYIKEDSIFVEPVTKDIFQEMPF